MVRQVIAKATGLPRAPSRGGWKGLLLVVIGGGAVLWHVLACTESPMAFSRNGDLAFVTMEPYDVEHVELAGPHDYRLMILPKGGKSVRVVEESSDNMLSAPAYSPDGQQYAYLRVPLLSPKRVTELEDRAQATTQAIHEATSMPTSEPATGPAPEVKVEDLTLPGMETTEEFVESAQFVPPAQAELVIRDARTDAVISTTHVTLRLLSSKPSDNYLKLYILTRPQFGPDGKWIYFCAGGVAMAVNPADKTVRYLAAPAELASLSPDGKVLAVYTDGWIAFIRTDGTQSLYTRWSRKISLCGFGWFDNQTLAVSEHIKPLNDQPEEMFLDLVGTDGKVRSQKQIAVPVKGQEVMEELAVSPDGKHMAVATESSAYFLGPDGKVIREVKGDEHGSGLFQPTFTPDSKQVAFKVAQKDSHAMTGIAFYTPEGREISQVKIQPIKEGTTHPASMPASEPAAEQ